MTRKQKNRAFFTIFQVITPNLVAFTSGLLLLFAGLYQIYPPAALIGSGLVLMAISVFGEKRT